jgi:hypothetical protein
LVHAGEVLLIGLSSTGSSPSLGSSFLAFTSRK